MYSVFWNFAKVTEITLGRGTENDQKIVPDINLFNPMEKLAVNMKLSLSSFPNSVNIYS